MDIEHLLRREMVERGVSSIMIVPVRGGFQVSAKQNGGAFKVEMQADPADALYNALVHPVRDGETARSNPIKRRERHEDLI